MATASSRSVITSHVILPYDLPILTDDLKHRARTELFEDKETKIHSLKLLRTMLEEEPNLNYMDEDDFLIMFLRARKYDVKKAFQMIKNFYHVKMKHSELYLNYDNNDVIRALRENSLGIFPYRDHEGCCIILLRAENWNPQINSFADHLRVLTGGLLDAISYPASQVAGFKIIVDWKGISAHHLPQLSNPRYLWLLAEALQNSFPARFRGIHMVNEGIVFTASWTILKQFLTKKISDRCHFHGKHVNKLHKYMSPAILPAEYGGELPSFDNTDWADKIISNLDYLAHINKFGYTKTKRKKSV